VNPTAQAMVVAQLEVEAELEALRREVRSQLHMLGGWVNPHREQ